ncbi:MAG: HAMP domain-containing sensor histidine kinase [Pseudomonadota bacterium]
MKLATIRSHWWPYTLFGRLTLILCVGLVAAHTLSFGLILYEKAQSSKAMMIYYLGKDVASSIAILERVPAAERASWLDKLARNRYYYVLGPGPQGKPYQSPLCKEIVEVVSAAIGHQYAINTTAKDDALQGPQLNLHLALVDGTPVTVVLSPPDMAISPWVPVILTIQLAILALFTWLAVRVAARPLAQLAHAADMLTPDMQTAPLPEDGPLEVARAAAAFNAMQRRISAYLAERVQILAAVSHDLQTPITRLRLRADMLDDEVQRDKMLGDLTAMQMLVEQGIAYARSQSQAQAPDEAPCRIDLDALLRSLVYDYQDAGQTVALDGQLGQPFTSRPQTLRRILSNLVDNALKFGREVEIQVKAAAGQVSIAVLDRGPGIPQDQLSAVLQPFYRIENSRNRETGGSGLGLAIVQQLIVSLGGRLTLSNRDGGGLMVSLLIPLQLGENRARAAYGE